MNPCCSSPLRHALTITLLLTLPVAAQDLSPRISEDGLYVHDPRSNLAWPRCVEGMTWNGTTCTGQPQLFDRAQAMAMATERWKKEDVRWRLPRANELQRLVNKNSAPTGMDPQLFPNAPKEWHWSSSSTVRTEKINPYNYGAVMQGHTNSGGTNMDFSHGWAVHMGTGESRGDVNKSSRLPLRLVRPIPAD